MCKCVFTYCMYICMYVCTYVYCTYSNMSVSIKYVQPLKTHVLRNQIQNTDTRMYIHIRTCIHTYVPVLTVVGTLLLGTKDDKGCCGTVTGIGVSLTVSGTTGASSTDSITFMQSKKYF